MLKVVDERKVDNDEIKEGIQEEVKQWGEEVNNYLNEEIKAISARYKELIGEFNEAVKLESGDIGANDLPDAASDDTQAENTQLDVSHIGDDGGENETTGWDDFKRFVDGIGVKWLVDVVNVVTPFVAPVVGLISLLVHVFGDDDDAENSRRRDEIRAENEAERCRAIQKERMMREIKEKSRRISRKMSTSMISNARKNITDWFAPIMEKFDKVIAGNSEEKEAVNNDIRTAEQLKAQLGNQMAVYRNFYNL